MYLYNYNYIIVIFLLFFLVLPVNCRLACKYIDMLLWQIRSCTRSSVTEIYSVNVIRNSDAHM